MFSKDFIFKNFKKNKIRAKVKKNLKNLLKMLKNYLLQKILKLRKY